MIINNEIWFCPFILYFTFVRIKTNFTADLCLNAIVICLLILGIFMLSVQLWQDNIPGIIFQWDEGGRKILPLSSKELRVNIVGKTVGTKREKNVLYWSAKSDLPPDRTSRDFPRTVKIWSRADHESILSKHYFYFLWIQLLSQVDRCSKLVSWHTLEIALDTRR